MIRKSKVNFARAWVDAGFDHLSFSSINMPNAHFGFRYCYLTKEQRREMLVGDAAILGSAVHQAIQNRLCHGLDREQALKDAHDYYDFSEARPDAEKRARYRESIKRMSDVACDALSQYGFYKSKDEEQIVTRLDGIEIDILGYIDLIVPGKFLCDIKCKAPRKNAKAKSGFSKAPIPKKPEKKDVMQVSLYAHATGVMPTICYVTEDEAVIYTPQNCDELKPFALADALEELRQSAMIKQNLISLTGGDARKIALITEPDWNHRFLWDIEPDLLSEARKLWHQ